MNNTLNPRIRAAIINYDPTAPNALNVSEFCTSLKISRSVFYKIRTRAALVSAAALHPESRAPKNPARTYGPAVTNELVRIRKQLKINGWDYGPRSIQYDAALVPYFPGGKIPSVATIARLLASVGHVDAAPRKRPKSSYIPFASSTAMALWQMDAFEYKLSTGKAATVYQLLDDATRYDVGTVARARHENSADAQIVLERAIAEHGAPRELLSDNSGAFNQLRKGIIGAVEAFLASRGTMPITGLPGKPTTQGKNERSHQTLIKFLDANKPTTLDQLNARISHYREHYNHRRPHQSLNQSTPAQAWKLLEHTPASEPIPLAVLEAKASEYRQRRKTKENRTDLWRVAIGKNGNPLDRELHEQTANQTMIEVTKSNRKVYSQGWRIRMPVIFGDRQVYRSITDTEFILADPRTGTVAFSFPLPLVALNVNGFHIASHNIRGVYMAEPSTVWTNRHNKALMVFALREKEIPEAFER